MNRVIFKESIGDIPFFAEKEDKPIFGQYVKNTFINRFKEQLNKKFGKPEGMIVEAVSETEGHLQKPGYLGYYEEARQNKDKKPTLF